MAPQRNDLRRQGAVGWLLGCGFAVAAFSQAKVQVFDRQSVLDEADKYAHFDIEKTEPARRGSVLSADGKILAQSADTYELGLTYDRVPQSPGFYVALSEATGIPATELTNPAEGQKGRVWRTPLSADQARRVRDVRRKWEADGVSLDQSKVRDYPMADATAGIVGAYRDRTPIAGIEKSMNAELAGTSGEARGFIDRTGAFVEDKDRSTKKRVNGANVTLTIDSNIQSSAVQALKTAVESNKAKAGCAIVMDPKTGDILACVNWPTFDPGASWEPGADYNMATMGAYEPGSTFKILTLAKGLDDGVLNLSDRFNCVGQMNVGKVTIHCASHGGSSAHGNIGLEDAIARSCNTAAANWALKIGHDPMVAFMDHLGLFEKTDIGLPSERTGVFNRKEWAPKLQLATVGFGQSMGCVPVNLAAAYSMIANGGMMMKPRLIKSVGDTVEPVRERGQMVKPETANTVMHMMESVIESEHGTGKTLRIPGYTLAGKTGTAQKVGTAKGMFVANFVGMVPARNPKAVVLVMIDSPSAGQHFGAVVAGPVFLDIAKSIIRRYGIPADSAAGR